MSTHPWRGRAWVRNPSNAFIADPPPCARCGNPADARDSAGWAWCFPDYDERAEHRRANADDFDKALGLDPAPVLTTRYLTGEKP